MVEDTCMHSHSMLHKKLCEMVIRLCKRFVKTESQMVCAPFVIWFMYCTQPNLCVCTMATWLAT